MRGAARIAVVLAVLTVGAPAAAADDGDPLVNACLTRVAITDCTANVPSNTIGIEPSPDGRHVYVGTIGFDPVGLLLYDRAPNGALTMRARPVGCVSASGNQYGQADDLEQVWDLAMDRAGHNVYAASSGSGSLIVFDRDPTTGVLTRKPGVAGLLRTRLGDLYGTPRQPRGGERRREPERTVGLPPHRRRPGGLRARHADRCSHAAPERRRCLTESPVAGCADAAGLAGNGFSISMSPDGKHLYVPFTEPGGISVFERTSDGSLTQDVGTLGGCISFSGQSGDDPAIECLDGPNPLLATFVTGIDSTTGATVYSGGAFGVLAYTRNDETGALTQTDCVHTPPAPPGCDEGRGVDGVFSIAVTPTGDEVVTYAFTSSVLAFFRRDAAAGALTRRTGAAGCVNVNGSGCAKLAGLGGLGQMALAPNGLDVYVAGIRAASSATCGGTSAPAARRRASR